MDTHRIEGIKYNFDRLSDGEVLGIRSYLQEAQARIVGEIALLDGVLAGRNGQEELDLGSYAEADVSHIVRAEE